MTRYLQMLASALVCLVLAQTQAAPPETVAHLAAVSELAGSFRQERHLQDLSLPLISTGRFQYQREAGLVWHTETPFDSTLTIQPDGTITRQTGNGSQSLPTPPGLASVFLAVFSGDLQALAQLFRIREVDTGQGWQLILEPRGSSANAIDTIELSGSDHVERIHMRETGGDSTLIELNVATSDGH